MPINTPLALAMMNAMEKADKQCIKTLRITPRIADILQREADAMRTPEELKNKAYSIAGLSHRLRMRELKERAEVGLPKRKIGRPKKVVTE